MKKISLSLIILGIAVLSFGQNYKTAVGFALKPGFATRNPLNKKYNENLRFSTSAGLVFSQQICKDFLYLESGLNFMDRGFRTNIHLLDSAGRELGISDCREIEYYLELPVGLAYKHNGFHIEAGPTISYYLLRRYVVDKKLISTEKSYQPDKFIFGYQFLIGYEMKLSDKLLMNFNGFLNQTIKVHFLNFGIDCGMKYIII